MRRTFWTIGALVLGLGMVMLAGCEAARPTKTNPHGAKTSGSHMGWHAGGLDCGNCGKTECIDCKKAEPVRGPQHPAPPPRKAAVLPPPPPPVQARPAPANQLCAEVFFPTGTRNTSTVHLQKCAPAEVMVGADFDYVITASNISSMTLKNVIVTDQMPDNYTLTKTEPAVSNRDGVYIRWALGDLAPGQSRQILVTGNASAAGKLVNCVTVTYDLPACLAIAVINPQLSLTKTAPAEVLKCDDIPVKLVVTNTGQGPARDVKLVDNLPEGMVTSDGKSVASIDVGTLEQGQSREFVLNVKATRTGSFVNRALVTGRGGLNAESSASTRVTMPVLAVSKTGPERRYVGRPITYDIVVSNTGDGDSKDTVLEDPIPAGTSWVQASDGGTPQGNKVVWNLGTLKPGDSRKVSLTVSGNQIGQVKNVATARAYCAQPASGEAITMVDGISAILLEVIDLNDPIEKGADTTYQITVTNQGSSDGTNIQIKCELEDTMQFVAGEGATRGVAAGNVITFDPLASLAPKAKASWRVKVKAVGTGDVRFKVFMTSNETDRDVRETESTHFYE